MLKTTEVTARLFLVVSVMIQEAVHQKPDTPALSSPALKPSGGSTQHPEKAKGLEWHLAPFCTTCQAKMLTKELYLPPALSPPVQSGR